MLNVPLCNFGGRKLGCYGQEQCCVQVETCSEVKRDMWTVLRDA